MSTVDARRINEKTGDRLLVVNHAGRIQRSPVFDYNPRIADAPGPGVRRLLNCPGARPYIKSKSDARWEWKQWNIEPGELWITPEERLRALWARGLVMIEPHVKVPGSNKEWAFTRWQKVVDAMPAVDFVQPLRPGTRALDDVVCFSGSFRETCAVLGCCEAFVGTEGALHHAAAALSVPAVVLWSEFIAPEFTGYPSQVNIRHAGDACGSRLPCASCRDSMDAITVSEVVEGLRGLLC